MQLNDLLILLGIAIDECLLKETDSITLLAINSHNMKIEGRNELGEEFEITIPRE